MNAHVWIDGAVVAAEHAKISVFDRGFLYGDSVYEVMRTVSTRAIGLGMKVLGYDPYPPTDFVKQHGITMVSLEDLLATSDFVSLHSPMTPATKHLINDKSIATMKDGAVVINTARGPLIDEPALIRALKSGKLRAAGLDVFEVEPLPADSRAVKRRKVRASSASTSLSIIRD